MKALALNLLAATAIHAQASTLPTTNLQMKIEVATITEISMLPAGRQPAAHDPQVKVAKMTGTVRGKGKITWDIGSKTVILVNSKPHKLDQTIVGLTCHVYTPASLIVDTITCNR